MTTSELLQACLSAFNETPNKTLRNNKGNFTNTYDIASAIEDHLKRKTLSITVYYYYRVYQQYLQNHNLQDDSDTITVESLIDFVDNQIDEDQRVQLLEFCKQAY